MYEVSFERAAERDLRRLSSENFTRIIALMNALGENPDRLVAVRSPDRGATGEYESVMIGSLMQLTITPWSSELC